jgi:hypothetical protein
MKMMMGLVMGSLGSSNRDKIALPSFSSFPPLLLLAVSRDLHHQHHQGR